MGVSRMILAILLFQIFKSIFIPNPIDWFITFLLGFFYLIILFRLV